MSAADADVADAPTGPRKKHRHDRGEEDHGAVYAAGTTRTIQALLGLWVALTVALVVYALVAGSRPHPTSTPPAAITR